MMKILCKFEVLEDLTFCTKDVEDTLYHLPEESIWICDPMIFKLPKGHYMVMSEHFETDPYGDVFKVDGERAKTNIYERSELEALEEHGLIRFTQRFE